MIVKKVRFFKLFFSFSIFRLLFYIIMILLHDSDSYDFHCFNSYKHILCFASEILKIFFLDFFWQLNLNLSGTFSNFENSRW